MSQSTPQFRNCQICGMAVDGAGHCRNPDCGNSRHVKQRVICTELYRTGEISKADYLGDLAFTRQRLTNRHVKGYHFFALGAARLMRRSKRWRAFFRMIAQARADDIAYLQGRRYSRSLKGRAIRLIAEPTCFLLSYIPAERDVDALYADTSN